MDNAWRSMRVRGRGGESGFAFVNARARSASDLLAFAAGLLRYAIVGGSGRLGVASGLSESGLFLKSKYAGGGPSNSAWTVRRGLCTGSIERLD